VHAQLGAVAAGGSALGECEHDPGRIGRDRTSHAGQSSRGADCPPAWPASADDLLVAVCDHVHETLPATRERLHWSVPDPVAADTDEAFEAAYTDIAGRIDRLAPALDGRQ
jgi:hypothetical protein